MYLLFSTFFFLCLLISDYLQISQKKIPIMIFSMTGYCGIPGLIIFLTIRNWTIQSSGLLLFLKGLFVLLSLLALMYMLFFEIALSPQFEKTEERKVYSHGTYAIVRHPAFYPFFLLLLFLTLLTGSREFIINAVYLVFLDFLLILIEDLIIFPKVFSNYSDYKSEVPFLIPGVPPGYK